MSDPAATRHAWAEQANAAAKDDDGKLSYEGAVAFGGETLHRWRLGNGLTVLVLVDASAPVVAYHTWFNVGLAARASPARRASRTSSST